MKVREILEYIKDKQRHGHYMIIYFNYLDSDYKDIADYDRERKRQGLPNLIRIMEEFGIKEEDAMYNTKANKLGANTIEFMGSGKDVVELMKKALCDFKNIYIENAILTSPDKSIEEGTAVLSLLINIPEENKWISIYYTHYDEGTGYGSITYKEHSYIERKFPQDIVDRSRGVRFPWGNNSLTEEQILDEILERRKCKITIDISLDELKLLTEEDILNLQNAFKHFIKRIEDSMKDAEKNKDEHTQNYKVHAELKVTVPRIKDRSITIDTEMKTSIELF